MTPVAAAINPHKESEDARRISLMIGRAVLTAADDAAKRQFVQFTALQGEVKDGVERVQQYGFAGAQSTATVNAPGLSAGTDEETDDRLRARVLERIQQPPHGGAAHDYVTWAKEVAGVTRAWVYPEQLGLGTVQVIFVMDDKEGTIIPDSTEVETVQDYIDAACPVTADVTVTAPVADAIDFTINISPNTSIVQQAIQAELEDFFKREAEPGGTLYLSRIREAISTAAGEFAHVLVTPSANIVSSFGDLPVLGNITFEAM